MSTSYSPQVATNGLILLLDAANTKSYPGSGATWTDLSGEGNNMTLSNTTFGNGVLNFNGSTSYGDLGANMTLATAGATISTWAKVTDFTTLSGTHTQQARILVTSTDKNGDSLIGFWNGGYGWESQTNGIPYEVNTSNTPAVAAPDISPGAWFNFVLVFDTGISYAYVNGEFITSIACSPQLDFRYLGIGSVNTNYPDYLYGSIGMLGVHNTPLSAQEVLQNYNALKGRYQV